MMHGLIEGLLPMGWLLTAFLVSYWTMKAIEPKKAVVLVTLEHPRHRKAA
jgi:hypothetical protein